MTNGANSSLGDRAWTIAEAHIGRSDLRTAAYYQINAIAHGRTDAASIREHAILIGRIASSEVDAGRHEVAIAMLDELEARLLSQVEPVHPDALGAVLDEVSRLDRVRVELSAKAARSESEALERSALDAGHEALDAVRTGAFHYKIPTDPSATTARLELAQQMLAHPDAETLLTASQLDELRKYAEDLGSRRRVDMAIEDAHALAERASSQPDDRVKSALLQQAEATLSDAVLVLHTLGDVRQKKLLDALNEVERRAEELRNARIKSLSEGVWTRWREAKGDDLAKVREWRRRTERGDVSATAQLARCQALLSSLMEVQRRIEHDGVRGEIDKIAIELQGASLHAAGEQRRRLNSYALSGLERTMESAGKHAGIVVDDEAKIADALQHHLEDLDASLLSPEVGRVYSEVLEYFVARLDAPSGAKSDFEKPSSRLRLLKKLASAKKKTLADF